MFNYGKKEGTMAAVTVVLSIIPILLTLAFFPQLGDQVAMRFSSSGEVLRWGSKFELLIAPLLCLGVGLGTIATGVRQAKRYEQQDFTMARLTFRRAARSGLVTSVIFVVASIYLLVAALTGHGFGF